MTRFRRRLLNASTATALGLSPGACSTEGFAIK
jgi:hypothetical protein